MRARLFWALTGTAGALCLILAAWGWILELRPTSVSGWVDVSVRSIKALLLSDIYFDYSESAAGPWLEASRALGLVVSLALAGRIAIFALSGRASGFILSRRRAHDLVIGDGPAAEAYVLLNPSGRVTWLCGCEEPKLADLARLPRRDGIDRQLKDAGGARARRIVIDEGDDASSWQTAREVARRLPDAEVLVHIADAWLNEKLNRSGDEKRLIAFSYSGGAARQVMLAHPPFLLARRLGAEGQHILVVGFGALGQALAREFFATSVTGENAAMMVTVIDPEADVRRRDFLGRHPGLPGVADLACIDGDVRLEDDALEAALVARVRRCAIAAVYVALPESAHPLSAAIALIERAGRSGLFRAPVFLCAPNGAGAPRRRHGAGRVGDGADDPGDDLLGERALAPFGSWADALDGSGIGAGEVDARARAFHDAYRRNLSGRGGPADCPWDELAEDYRRSNRRLAAHVRAKLSEAGFDLAGWLGAVEGGRPAFDLPEWRAGIDEDLIERLARQEHRRWMMERALNGWSFGPVRDNLARRHPDMKPYDQLSEEAREKDRVMVRESLELIGRLTAR